MYVCMYVQCMISVLFFDFIKKHVDLQYLCPWFITISLLHLLMA